MPFIFKVGAQMSTPTAAVRSPASGRMSQKLQPSFVDKIAMVYAPTAKKPA